MPHIPKGWAFAVLMAVAVAGAGYGVVYERSEQTYKTKQQAARLTGGNPDAGLVAIGRFGCGGCHEIPGAPGATGQVGPSLKGVATRRYLAGHLSNDPRAMMQWIRFPQTLEPGVVMPQMGVDERQGRDIAAYLYTLK